MRLSSANYCQRFSLMALSPIALVILTLFSGCSVKGPAATIPPYLQSEIQKRPPVEGDLTTYATHGPYGGTVFCVASRGNTLIAGTGNGIFRSTLENRIWRRAEIQRIWAVYSIIAVNEVYFAGTNQGIFKSDDDGLTWQTVNPTIWAFRFVIFRDRLLALSVDGLYQSNLMGTSWSQVKIPPVSLFSGNPLLATVNDQVFLGSLGKIFRTRNLDTWDRVDEGFVERAGVGLLGLKEVHNELFAVIGTYDRDPPGQVFATSDGTAWRQVPLPGSLDPRELISSADGFFVRDSGKIVSFENGSWRELRLLPSVRQILALANVNNEIALATESGVFTRPANATSWREWNIGLSVEQIYDGILKTIEGQSFTVFDGNVFRSLDQGKAWQRLILTPADQLLRAPFAKDLALTKDSVFVATNQGLFAGKVTDETLSKLPLNVPSGEDGSQSEIYEMETLQNRLLFVGIDGHVFVSQNNGISWEETRGLPRASAPTSNEESPILEVVGEQLFYSDLRQGPKVFRFVIDRNIWELVSEGLRQNPVTAFASAGDVTYAAASIQATAAAKLYPDLFRLDQQSGNTWHQVATIGLTGKVNALWADAKHPEVIIAGTTDGLFWSNDGCEHFRKVTVNQRNNQSVSAISEINGQLFISTNSGVFYVYDQIPRGAWYAQWIDLIKQNKGPVLATAFVIFLLVVLSTRLISLLLQLDLWGINTIAPAFYLTPFGRWKLYRRYRDHLLGHPDVKYSVEHYVDLPYTTQGMRDDSEADGQPEEVIKLSDAFTQLYRSSRVAVIADGGNGKSTLCAALAHRCVKQKDIFAAKRLEPVVIDGLSYAGNLLSSITNALREDRAYVNETIVASQLSAGNLLIIFDGFTEIRESYLPSASSSDIPEFIRRHPDTPFVFTSRSQLPDPLQNALHDVITIKLIAIDDSDTLKKFLSQYLKRGEQEVRTLIEEIEIKFKDLPRIPLLLKLVATVYDKKARVPKDKAALFADYAEQVLRPAATGIDEPVGVNYALRHLVRESFLQSGGDRGLTIQQGVELLDQIKETLAAYDIKTSAIRLLKILTLAGLYKEVRGKLKFFHDSFESYFAALALESDFHAKKYELLKRCARNERFAETWLFLNEILEEPAEKQKLNQLRSEAEDDLARTRYLQRQRDNSVDYFMSLSSDGNRYSLETEIDGQKQAFQLSISRDDLANLADELRAELTNLARQIQLASDVCDVSVRYLPHLANLGHYAFKEFFGNEEVSGVLSKLQSINGTVSLQIATDSCFFPWEFLYPPDPDSKLSVDHFWGLNHVISRIVVQDPRPAVADATKPPAGETIRVGLLADASIDHVAQSEIDFFKQLAANQQIALSVFSPSDSSDRQVRINDLKEFLARPFDVVHFACNVSYDKESPLNSTIELGNRWLLKLSDIEYYNILLTGEPLVVMNTCEAGNLSPTKVASFAAAFLKRGARGVIATESFIPSVSAADFTKELYIGLLEGVSLGDVLLRTRQILWKRFHNPAGLMYSMYAPPSLKLATNGTHLTT